MQLRETVHRNLANMITAIRLIGAFALIFLDPEQMSFLIVFTVCGITDCVDGTVARRLNIQSPLGSRLDSISDLSFYTIMMVKEIRRLVRMLPGAIWIFVGIVLLIRIGDYIYAALRFHRFASPHTILNKVTSCMMFLIPYLMCPQTWFTVYGFTLVSVAFVAAVQELVFHIRGEERHREEQLPGRAA